MKEIFSIVLTPVFVIAVMFVLNIISRVATRLINDDDTSVGPESAIGSFLIHAVFGVIILRMRIICDRSDDGDISIRSWIDRMSETTPSPEHIEWMRKAYCEGAAGLAVFKSFQDGTIDQHWIWGVDTDREKGFTNELDELRVEQYAEGFGLVVVYDLYAAKNRDLFIKELEEDDRRVKELIENENK